MLDSTFLEIGGVRLGRRSSTADFEAALAGERAKHRLSAYSDDGAPTRSGPSSHEAPPKLLDFLRHLLLARADLRANESPRWATWWQTNEDYGTALRILRTTVAVTGSPEAGWQRSFDAVLGYVQSFTGEGPVSLEAIEADLLAFAGIGSVVRQNLTRRYQQLVAEARDPTAISAVQENTAGRRLLMGAWIEGRLSLHHFSMVWRPLFELEELSTLPDPGIPYIGERIVGSNSPQARDDVVAPYPQPHADNLPVASAASGIPPARSSGAEKHPAARLAIEASQRLWRDHGHEWAPRPTDYWEALWILRQARAQSENHFWPFFWFALVGLVDQVDPGSGLAPIATNYPALFEVGRTVVMSFDNATRFRRQDHQWVYQNRDPWPTQPVLLPNWRPSAGMLSHAWDDTTAEKTFGRRWRNLLWLPSRLAECEPNPAAPYFEERPDPHAEKGEASGPGAQESPARPSAHSPSHSPKGGSSGSVEQASGSTSAARQWPNGVRARDLPDFLGQLFGVDAPEDSTARNWRDKLADPDTGLSDLNIVFEAEGGTMSARTAATLLLLTSDEREVLRRKLRIGQRGRPKARATSERPDFLGDDDT